jgi:hypothetical protein
MRAFLAGTCLALAACGAPTTSGDDDQGGGGGGGGGGGDGSGSGSADTAKRVKFIAMGDTGKGNTDQRAVAIRIRDLCAARGCDFVLMLGDNIYDAGVDSVTDEQWQTKFEQPYADINLPFYAVLGNHDNGGNLLFDAPGIGNEFDKGKLEVNYTSVSTKWKMPATHYTFTKNHVGIIALDTNAIMWNNTDYGDQNAWITTAIAETATMDWVFVAGHHPYRSNGTHGNAGDYVTIPNPLPVQNGETVKEFFDAHVCGLGQVYFSGHDHSRQWLDEPTALCGTQMIVTGAGASTTEIRDRGNKAFYEDATKPGFMYVDIEDNKFTGEFWDIDGVMNYSRTFTK